MNLTELYKLNEKPRLYERGTRLMWTDEHISKQLLKIHLDPDNDLASRKPAAIKKTIEWILKQVPEKRLTILDLGCGPGLYDEIFALKGHIVTGVDFSKNSIEYARELALSKKLNIVYKNYNYLLLDECDKFDLVILIYTDFGTLTPEKQEQLLKKIQRALKPGGVFIFDVLNDSEIQGKLAPKTWEVSEGGFWRAGKYAALTESFHYPENKVILTQHIIIEDDEISVYRFWSHYYSRKRIEELLVSAGFKKPSFSGNVLPKDDAWSKKHITFVTAEK
jgi:SAM-dependent methyltransferase